MEARGGARPRAFAAFAPRRGRERDRSAARPPRRPRTTRTTAISDAAVPNPPREDADAAGARRSRPVGDAWADLAPPRANPNRARELAQTSAATPTPTPTPGARDAAASTSSFRAVGVAGVSIPVPTPTPLALGVGGAVVGVAALASALRSNPRAKEELAHLRALADHRAEVLRAFGTGPRGDDREMFPVVWRYAAQIASDYDDVPGLPRGLPTTSIYAEIVKTGAIGAYASLYDNVKNVNVLGHPVRLRTEADLTHKPPRPKADADDCERFVAAVLRGEDDDDARDDVGIGWLVPRKLEIMAYRNAMVTAIYLVEDTLTHFEARFFGTSYSFEFARAREGWRAGRNFPKLSDAALRRLAREEIKTPMWLRLLPGVEANAGKVAVALAGEVVGSTEINFLGLPLRFSLQPRPDEAFSSDLGRIPSLSEAGGLSTGGGELLPRFKSPKKLLAKLVHRDDGERAARERRRERDVAPEITAAGVKTSAETTKIIENYVDAFLENRPRRGLERAIDPFFFGAKLERETYVGFLSAIIGTIENSVICQLLGMDVVLNVAGGGRDEKSGAVKPPNLAAFKVSADFGDNRREIETLVDWLMMDPMYNVRAVPDAIERAIYVNAFELLTNILAGALSTLQIELLGQAVRLRLRESNAVGGATVGASKMARFRPDAETLRRFASEFSAVPALQDIMMNVYAFVLAFAAYELGQVELNLVGRRLKLALATPSDAGEEEGLLAAAVAAEESEFNARLRRALDTLVEEMIDVADADAGPDASAGGAATTRVGGAARQTKQKKNAFLKGVSGVFASFGGTADYDDEEEEEEGEERRPRDVDGVVYAVFLARHAPATDEFPFPHLTPEDFRAAVSDLLKALRPDRGGGVVPEAAVRRVSDAADVNGDGVIQWAEFYFAGTELAAVIDAAAEKSGEA